MATRSDKNQLFQITSNVKARNGQETSFQLEIPAPMQFTSIDLSALHDAVALAKAPTKNDEASFAFMFAF